VKPWKLSMVSLFPSLSSYVLVKPKPQKLGSFCVGKLYVLGELTNHGS
jgi:hypothetical protein